MNAVTQILSKGPATIGDGIGFTNKVLVMRACDITGRLLHPSRPATALDSCFLQEAYAQAHPNKPRKPFSLSASPSSILSSSSADAQEFPLPSVFEAVQGFQAAYELEPTLAACWARSSWGEHMPEVVRFFPSWSCCLFLDTMISGF